MALRGIFAFCVGLLFAGALHAAFPSLEGPMKELETVRNALRDGLWNIARNHAEKAEDTQEVDAATRNKARLAQLEALSRERKPHEMLVRLNTWSDATNGTFRFWRAWANAETGGLAVASALLSQEFDDAALNIRAKRLEAQLALRQGDATRAAACFANLHNTLSNETERVSNGVAWARALHQLHQSEKALAILSETKADTAVTPIGDEARVLKADILAEAGRFAEAEVLWAGLDQDTVAAPIRRHAIFARSFIALTNEVQMVNAIAAIRAAIREDPSDPASAEAQLHLADILLEMKRPAEAEKEYRLFLESYSDVPQSAHALEGRGWAQYAQQDFARAAESFIAAAERYGDASPHDRDFCRIKCSDAYFAAKRFREAAEILRNITDSEYADRARFRRAEALELAGDAVAAEALYTILAAGTNLTFATEARLKCATAALRAGRTGEAQAACDAIINNAQTTPHQKARAHTARGRVLYRLMRFREASADFAQAATLDSDCAETSRFHQVLCLFAEGHDTEARTLADTLRGEAKNPQLVADVSLWCAKYDLNHRNAAAAAEGFEKAAAHYTDTQHRKEALLLAARANREAGFFDKTITLTSRLAHDESADSVLLVRTLLLQAATLMESARFADAALVAGRIEKLSSATPEDKIDAAFLRADALYELGADNAAHYNEALASFQRLSEQSDLPPSRKLEVAYKIGRTLEKLHREDEAADWYYVHVVLPYGAERARGVWFDSEAKRFFTRAAFALADYYETRGEHTAAARILERVESAGIPASREAGLRAQKLKTKGNSR